MWNTPSFGISNRVIKTGNLVFKRMSIWGFKPPQIDFLVKENIDMIHWNSTIHSPTPLLRRITDEDIWA